MKVLTYGHEPAQTNSQAGNRPTLFVGAPQYLSIPNVDVVKFSTGSRPLTVDLASHSSSSAGM